MCAHLGGMTRDEMRRRMSGAEYHDWIRYYNTEPFGLPIQDRRHSDLMASMWALHGGKDAPSENRIRSTWQYQPPENKEIDPETEAQMMLAKLQGL